MNKTYFLFIMLYGLNIYGMNKNMNQYGGKKSLKSDNYFSTESTNNNQFTENNKSFQNSQNEPDDLLPWGLRKQDSVLLTSDYETTKRQILYVLWNPS